MQSIRVLGGLEFFLTLDAALLVDRDLFFLGEAEGGNHALESRATPMEFFEFAGIEMLLGVPLILAVNYIVLLREPVSPCLVILEFLYVLSQPFPHTFDHDSLLIRADPRLAVYLTLLTPVVNVRVVADSYTQSVR